MVQRERSQLVWEALGALPARQHVALFLKEAEGQSYREIAEVLETSESAVETLLFRARRGLAKAYRRLEMARPERCRRAREVMAALVDGEATPVQQRALRAHVDGCRCCREEMEQVQHCSAAYAGLALLPVPALLTERVFGVVGATASGGAAAGAGKLIALVGAKSKLLAVTLTVTGGLTAGVMMAPAGPLNTVGEADSPTPTPARDAAEQAAPGASQEYEYEQAELGAVLSGPVRVGITVDGVGDVGVVVDGLAGIETHLGETIGVAEKLAQPVTAASQGLADGASTLVENAQPVVDGASASIQPELGVTAQALAGEIQADLP